MEVDKEEKLVNCSSKSIQYHVLSKITNNFSEDRILGRGGYGIVYEGQHENGDIVAVKKLSINSEQLDDKQFTNEVSLLMDLRHQNIVKLEGYCHHTEKEFMKCNDRHILVELVKKLLCFEYVSKGSLDNYLSDESSGFEWHERFRIIEGICNGIYYLHEGTGKDSIIHMDLKPANILLDENLVPKLADFGLSKLFGNDKTHTVAQTIIGSCGYMSPEYIERRVISKASDIYSFGVIIMDIITGRKQHRDELEFKEVLEKWKRRLAVSSQKHSLQASCNQVNICIEISLKCMVRNPKERPTIAQIIGCLAKCETTNWIVPDDGIETYLDFTRQKKKETLLDPSINEVFIEKNSITEISCPLQGRTMVLEMGIRGDLSRDNAARIIQRTYRVNYTRRTQMPGSLNALAVAEDRLKVIRSMFSRSTYQFQINRNVEELQRFADKITILLLDIDAIEGHDISIRARKKSMVVELDKMLDMADPGLRSEQNLLRATKVAQSTQIFDGSTCTVHSKELFTQDAAYIIHGGEVLRSLRSLAIAKTKLKEITFFFCNMVYRRRISKDSEEHQRFSNKINLLYMTVKEIEGPHLMVRSSKESMLAKLGGMMDILLENP